MERSEELLRPTAIRYGYVSKKANEARKRFENAPIKEIIERCGIKILYSFDISSPILVRVNGIYGILMPPSTNVYREKWSFAHEFAHYYLGHYDYPVDRVINGHYINLLTDDEIYILERESDIFVAEWLMPRDEFLKMVKKPITHQLVTEISKKLALSKEAVINRLIDFKFIEKRDDLIS
jgi:hypothetical protein